MKLPEWITILFRKETEVEKRYGYLTKIMETDETLKGLSEDEKTETINNHLRYMIDSGILDDELRIIKKQSPNKH